jgi:E3 ubiquitin-protein ligase MUL1
MNIGQITFHSILIATRIFSEHLVARGFAGFWTEQRKLVHISYNETPFTINNGNSTVEIIDALSAEVLDMDVVYDHYEPSSLSFFDHVFGFFTGVRQRGFQTTEELLRDGSYITAVGELELEGDKIRLQPTSAGPMFLTTATKNALVKRFQDAASSSLFKSLVCGTIAVVVLVVIGRKMYRRKKAEREERKIKEALERTRQKRRALARSSNVQDESQMCVVCLSNPKEVIVLPCGHVCLCEDCSSKITLQCPVCRTRIESKAAAFIT